MKNYQFILLALVALVLGFLGARVESIVGAQEDGPEVIHACVRPRSGEIRIIGPGESCRRIEEPLSWNAGGAVGGTHLPFYYCNECAWTAHLMDPDLFAGLDLEDAVLIYSGVYSMNMSGINLSSVNMQYGGFELTNLTDANLQGLDLRGGFIKDCDLTNANMLDANLQGCDIGGTNIWSNTTCPDGTNSDDNGGTCIGHLTPSP